MGGPRSGTLIELVDDECPYVRRRVVTALADLNSEGRTKITEVLISALTDSDGWVRARAVLGLAKNYSWATVLAIAPAVGDDEVNVSWRTIDALVGIGKPAVKSLIQLLDWPDSEIRYRVVKALGLIGDQRATRPLKKMLTDPNEKVRQRARLALQQIKYRASWEKIPSKTRKLWHWWQKLRGRD